MLTVNTFLWDIKCCLVFIITPLFLVNIFNTVIGNITYCSTHCKMIILIILLTFFIFFLSFGYECYISPHQAHYCSSYWFSGQYISFKQGHVCNAQFHLTISSQIVFTACKHVCIPFWIKIVCIISHCNVQESSEEKTQQLKERLSRLFQANERRCNRRVLYGSDLLQACTLSSEPGHTALTAGGWRWVGRESCLRAQRTCVATVSTLQSTLLSVEDRLEAANGLIKRYFSSVY